MIETAKDTVLREKVNHPELLRGLTELVDKCNFKLTSAEADLRYTEEHTRRLKLQLIQKQEQEIKSISLATAVNYLTRASMVQVQQQTNEELRNMLISELNTLAEAGL